MIADQESEWILWQILEGIKLINVQLMFQQV